jgi:hypothetical protein
MQGPLTCPNILQHEADGFTSSPKEGMLWIFITLKNPSPQLGLKPQTLGPMASTLTITPSRRLPMWLIIQPEMYHPVTSLNRNACKAKFKVTTINIQL